MFVYSLAGLEVTDPGGTEAAPVQENETTARSSVYQVLGRLFLHPDEEHYERAREGLWAKDVAAASALLPFELVVPGESVLPSETGKGEHVEAFDRLFGEAGTAPPFGGAYAEGGQKSELGRLYEYYGLGVREDGRPVDHLVTECDFMQFLAYKEAATGSERLRASYRRAELDFEARHLGAWVPAFVKRVRAGAPPPFFTWATGLLERFVEMDGDYLSSLVEAAAS